ncbi:MAG: hypothetical protein A2Z93_13585 [Curvibacter sp. GWA2_64_110]|nr:MAG: hypothetical protein A2Z93_13585 [Curvibacter sp. GWA2_64_110]HCY17336.1 hypothetical protein [Curvibacter sp.]
MMMLTFVAPVQNFVRGRQIGALWVTLLVLSVGYLGAKVGRSITKNICADSEMSIAAKRKRLWLFLAAMFPIYFIVFSITTAMAGH